MTGRYFCTARRKFWPGSCGQRGLGAVLVTDAEYVHAHSVSIDQERLAGLAAKQKILHRSKLYYYRRYLGAGPGAHGWRPGSSWGQCTGR